MSVRARLLLFAVCLQAAGAFGSATSASFAKESLGIDLATIPFGSTAETNGGYGKTDVPLSGIGLPDASGYLWVTNAMSEKYHRDFGNRVLKYGFRDGKLVAVRISMSAYGGPGFTGGAWNQELFEQRRKELVRIQNEYMKVRAAEKARLNSEGDYSFRYGAMCSPAPESLVVSEYQVTSNKK